MVFDYTFVGISPLSNFFTFNSRNIVQKTRERMFITITWISTERRISNPLISYFIIAFKG